MNAIPAISLSGLQAAQTRLDASAHNVANRQTEGFQPLVVQQTSDAQGGTSTRVERSSTPSPGLEDDLVQQLQAKNSFLANLKVFKAYDSMLGAQLDAQA